MGSALLLVILDYFLSHLPIPISKLHLNVVQSNVIYPSVPEYYEFDTNICSLLLLFLRITPFTLLTPTIEVLGVSYLHLGVCIHLIYPRTGFSQDFIHFFF